MNATSRALWKLGSGAALARRTVRIHCSSELFVRKDRQLLPICSTERPAKIGAVRAIEGKKTTIGNEKG